MNSTTSTDTQIERHSRCLCGINSFRVKFLRTELPLASHLCHCNTCRHTTGSLAFRYLPIVGIPSFDNNDSTPVDPDCKTLRGYRTSEHKVRYFCNVCATHLLCCTDETQWSVSSGSLDSTDEITNLISHTWVSDTIDGGLANHIQNVEDRTITRFATGIGSQEVPLSWGVKSQAPIDITSRERIHAHCNCGAVRFFITRPNALSTIPHSPYPDMLFPAVNTSTEEMMDSCDDKWWLAPPIQTTASSENSGVSSLGTGGAQYSDDDRKSHTRYLAGHCVCNDCRIGSGSEVQSWAFVPRFNLFEVGSDTPIELQHGADRPRGLNNYMSSPQTFREFCGTCGATVFWWHANDRPDIVDVSVGLLDQEGLGSRAAQWLKWQTERLSFIEVARKTEYLAALMDGLASYDETNVCL